MYILEVQGHFDAAHYLEGYKGDCANMHGHRWTYAIRLTGSTPNELGMLVDFKWVKQKMKEFAGPLDHTVINTVPPFDKMNPTAENLAREVYYMLLPHAGGDIGLDSVTIWESPECSVTYRED